jgi:hypothetical protein
VPLSAVRDFYSGPGPRTEREQWMLVTMANGAVVESSILDGPPLPRVYRVLSPTTLQAADPYVDMCLHDALFGPPPTGMSVVTERQPLHLGLGDRPATGISCIAKSHARQPCHPACPDPALCERMDILPLLPLLPRTGRAELSPDGEGTPPEFIAAREKRMAEAQHAARTMTEDEWRARCDAERAETTQRWARFMSADSGGRDATSLTISVADAPPPPGVACVRLGWDFDDSDSDTDAGLD